ncbi:hypothetical protein CRE_01905 [Caenorhabditis remanei]|uniref:Uncharacterized protein n=1 Tax=Caenorhabditis remanei TaxID=31234 RepID=E3LG76_CAERE|nr:hypothetical protein CRE_01905 [Caenorhabditis remanei]
MEEESRHQKQEQKGKREKALLFELCFGRSGGFIRRRKKGRRAKKETTGKMEKKKKIMMMVKMMEL